MSTRFDTIIIGAGFGGLGIGIALKQAGLNSFLILEKSGDVGGCWRENTYPGAVCDVPSHLYSFSFRPKHDWSRKFAPQAEILTYLRDCAEAYQLNAQLRLNSEVASVAYLGTEQGWQLTLTSGQHLQARFVVTACGQLSQPLMPRIEGLSQFQGAQFHSAHWDHAAKLQGQRVAVIGTGASAIQFIPQIAPHVRQLTVFQRSAPYVIPKPDRPYRPWEQALFKAMPWVQKLSRARIYASHEVRAVAFTRVPQAMAVVKSDFERQLRRQVPDAALRQRLTPDYPIGCKRILISNDFYPAMSRPNVQLVQDAIVRVRPDGVETADGTLHHADVLIHGTGFAATEFLTPMTVQGLNGQDLNQVWKNGAQAYLGMTVPGFPNFFMLYGPNTNLGHSSIVYMLESQIHHIVRCMSDMRIRQIKAIDVSATRFKKHNLAIDQGLRRTVWSSGCTSWYQTADGRNPVNWPGFTFSYRWLTRRADLSHYQVLA